MASNRKSICRLCRVEKTKLFLKGHKCSTDKCPFERKAYPPGEHGRARRRILGYGIQLREKQRLKRYYGMSEKQFKLFFMRAERKRGVTGEILLTMLERRLDNVVALIGFAHSRAHARQLIVHGHFRKNGRKATIPSMLVEKNDIISVHEKAEGSHEELNAIIESHENKEVPAWLNVNREEKTATVASFPKREDISMPVEERLVVELYSK